MVTTIVPDHFVISMMLLILGTLTYPVLRIKTSPSVQNMADAWSYFLLTAGTSLNNGLKIFLSAFFVNGKGFFRPKYLLLAVVLPAALLWGFCKWEYRTLRMASGDGEARKAKAKKMEARRKAKQRAYGQTEAY